MWATLSLSGVLFQCQAPSTKSVTQETATETPKVYRQAAEFEEQKGVWLIWPPAEHKQGYSNKAVTLKIIEQLINHTSVTVSCANDSLYQDAQKHIKQQFPEASIEITKVPSVELWARDMGPVIVEGENGEHIMADFNFDAWGYSDSTDKDTQIEEQFDVAIAKKLNLPVISTPMISEGGDREVNGKGTLLTVETVEQGRNPSMSKTEMEAEFKRMLGVSNVIWLKQGLKEDDHTFLGPIEAEEGLKAYTVITTNGHIDEFCRFVNDSTVLLAEVDPEDLHDPIAKENHRRMEENYQILKNATDQDGKPLRIVRMPLPKTILAKMQPGDPVYDYISTLDYQDGSTFPQGEEIHVVAAASYLNFLISNEVVIGQKYWKEGMDTAIKERDAQAKAVLESVFPDRQVIMLDALSINLGGGGIHCISMQLPAARPTAL
ncbi:agmatine deiminase family protein [Algivirga pacifica]|uniref:Agmatine deiminase family protein n=1 Tax=Algivirga pacifica TaxID=1162670 RepID=A0ABP9CXJ2_9BACT